MTHSFLLEIGVEEMPAHVVTPSIKQLVARVSDYLADQRISFEQVEEFATPRRLALLLSGLDDKQPDIQTEVKGPAKKNRPGCRRQLDKGSNWLYQGPRC